MEVLIMLLTPIGPFLMLFFFAFKSTNEPHS